MKLLKELLESKQEHKEVELVLERYKHDDRFEKLYNKMVPDEGEAETEYGEAVRAIARLEYDYYNNGYQNAVDVRITMESKDNDFNDQISNLGEYLDFAVKKIGSDRSKSIKWYGYYDEICASGNENSGEINSESDFEDAAYRGAEALVNLIDELKSHEEIYNGDDEDDEYGWIPMDGNYTSLDSYEIEHMFKTIEKGLDDIHSVLDFNIEERDTWYKTELYDHLMQFAEENDAPSKVIAAIRYIEPRAELLSDDSDDDRFYDSTAQIKTWLVSLFESKKNAGHTLTESNVDGFYNGATVVIKKDSQYYDGSPEEFIVSQLDTERGRCWIGDKESGRGWYIPISELEIVDRDENEDEDENEYEDEFSQADIRRIKNAISDLEECKRNIEDSTRNALRILKDVKDLVDEYDRARYYWYGHIISATGDGDYPTHSTTIQSSINSMRKEIGLSIDD